MPSPLIMRTSLGPWGCAPPTMSMRRTSSNVPSSESESEKRAPLHQNHARALSAREVDIGGRFDLYILLMMCSESFLLVESDHVIKVSASRIQFMDKTTLGSVAILGVEYDWLGTIFYLSYLLFEYPRNLVLQRFPVGRWMSFNIFIWSISLAYQATFSDFAGFFVCRFHRCGLLD
ncbi:hypothetical protein BDN67DRAFT_498422 [Paxillus ammoniavirescens]|nr:hypothetical protein BDN67DRAFT_498422 [Paxillus ammoniavirescens]